ncbi:MULTISPECIES: CGNR zinc finger domain-containing protein [Streptomyces]|uniref:CGNR zinc finger domain-containing protein n=1 Tax=Streptomyces fimbriatus TaxID=68197 RepID=A0ABW0DDL5_STRFI
MSETDTAATAGPGLPQAPGAALHPALDLANSAIALPGGQFLDVLGTPSGATQWLVDHNPAPADAGLQEVCAARLRSLREQVRALLAAQVGGHPAPTTALAAVNDALTRVPTAAPLGWDSVRGMHRAAPHPIDRIVDQALGILAADAADLLTGPDAERMTACPSAPCNRYLLRTGRRHRCSVRCGARARATRAYARRTRTVTG